MLAEKDNSSRPAVCDTGSNQTWVHRDLLDKIELRGKAVSLNVPGFHGTQTTTSRAVQAKIGPANFMQDRRRLPTVHSQKNLETGASVHKVQEIQKSIRI